MEAVLVDIVSRVVTPRATLAGTACKYHSSHIYFCIRQKRKKTSRNLGVNPEGEPGDDDEHAGGDVDGGFRTWPLGRGDAIYASLFR